MILRQHLCLLIADARVHTTDRHCGIRRNSFKKPSRLTRCLKFGLRDLMIISTSQSSCKSSLTHIVEGRSPVLRGISVSALCVSYNGADAVLVVSSVGVHFSITSHDFPHLVCFFFFVYSVAASIFHQIFSAKLRRLGLWHYLKRSPWWRLITISCRRHAPPFFG